MKFTEAQMQHILLVCACLYNDGAQHQIDQTPFKEAQFEYIVRHAFSNLPEADENDEPANAEDNVIFVDFVNKKVIGG